MLPEIPQPQLVAVLDEVVFGLLAAADIHQPPVDAFRVAAAIGVPVVRDETQPGRARYVRLATAGLTSGCSSAGPSILLRSDPRPERLQWAVAHELGEHVAAEVFERLGIATVDIAVAARETVANHLANRLLLPTSMLAGAGAQCDWDLAALKTSFATASHELIARRMLEFEPLVCISIFDHGRLTLRRSSNSGRAPPLTPLEQSCQAAANRTGRPAARIGQAMRVRAWPVHEPGWKREILRSEPTDNCF